MTRLTLNFSEHDSVAQRHAKVSCCVFPGCQLQSIANGVRRWTWACAGFQHPHDACLRRTILAQRNEVPKARAS